MAEPPRADDGPGPESHGKITEPEPFDARLIPGGSFRAARTPIGINAFDRDDLPSYGKSEIDYRNTHAHPSASLRMP